MSVPVFFLGANTRPLVDTAHLTQGNLGGGMAAFYAVVADFDALSQTSKTGDRFWLGRVRLWL